MSADELKSNVWRWLKHYLYGCFAKSWNVAIDSVYGIVSVAAGAAVLPEKIQVPNWEMAGSIFAVRFAIAALGYFKDHPLPPTIEQ